MFRIRFHGRGGQGMKTASRILGTAFFKAGYQVQDAPRYGAERRGAPIFAYGRALPREIEDFLFTHPKIAEVTVFGVADARLGEQVAAWIQLRSGESASEDEIRRFCKYEIAHFKIPKYIRFVDELPMTITGKPQKFKMREAMQEQLQAG